MAKTATKSPQQQDLLNPEEEKLPVAASQEGNLPTPLDDTAEFEGDHSGLENVTAADVVIPRLTILQKLSPQLDRARPEYIPEAQEGDFCDIATGDIFRGSVEIIPVHYAKIYLEWAPKNSGKGLQGNHGMDASILSQCTKDDKGRNLLPNGNYIAETATYYCLNVNAGFRRAFIPLTSTQLKNSKKWMTLITGEKGRRPDGSTFQLPLYYRSWVATTIDERNAEGTWKGWKFSPGRPINIIDPTKRLLEEAKQFYSDASQSLVRGDLDEEQHDEPARRVVDEKEAF